MGEFWSSLITTARSIIIGFGGYETLKFLCFRKKQARIVEAQADSDEFHVLREHIEFLQQQLKEKEERFAEQTNLLRQRNSEILEITESKNAVILQLTEKISELQLNLQKFKCVVPKCTNRQPQNGY
jgi:CRISPR/Cas system CMR-associated protein Cmr5 small subunit